VYLVALDDTLIEKGVNMEFQISYKIKQIIYDLNGLAIILKLLQNGNEREQLVCIELICSLCFNQQVRDCLKYDKRTVKFIEDFENVVSVVVFVRIEKNVEVVKTDEVTIEALELDEENIHLHLKI
jgi:hypothetical protein